MKIINFHIGTQTLLALSKRGSQTVTGVGRSDNKCKPHFFQGAWVFHLVSEFGPNLAISKSPLYLTTANPVDHGSVCTD